MSRTPVLRRLLAVALVSSLGTLAACTSPNDDEAGPQISLVPRVGVTSIEGDLQSELLAAIYARVLESNGVRVVRKEPVSLERAEYLAAMADGEFQLIPEYTRPLLNHLLDTGAGTSTTVSDTGAEDVTATTRAPITIPSADTTTTVATAESTTSVADTTPAESSTTSSTSSTTTTVVEPPTNPFSLIAQITAINNALPSSLQVYAGALAEDRTSIACTPAFADRVATFQFATLTDLASLAPQVRFGATAEFYADDTNGMPALVRTYAPEFAEEQTLTSEQIATALADDTVDCVAIGSLDPLVVTEDLLLPFDDQYMVPMNVAVVLMTSSTVTMPEVGSALDSLTAALTTVRLGQMLREIRDNGTPVTVVANAFVDSLGL